MVSSTHSHANLAVTDRTYDEIAGKLRAAGYDHVFGDDGTIDMHGIALVSTPAQAHERHPSVQGVFQFFSYSHLPAHLQLASRPFFDLAATIANGPQNAETTMALRKLLEAKDCAVRAILAK